MRVDAPVCPGPGHCKSPVRQLGCSWDHELPRQAAKVLNVNFGTLLRFKQFNEIQFHVFCEYQYCLSLH